MLLFQFHFLYGTCHLVFAVFLFLSITKDDHWSPSLSFDVTFSECTTSLCPHRIAVCDRHKFSDPESVAAFDLLCHDFEVNPSVNVFSMCNDVTAQLRSAASEAVPSSGSNPQNFWVSPHTWKLISATQRIRRARSYLGMRSNPYL